MTEQWQELKETIIELRDNDGTGTQQEVCKFLANLMDVLEKQMSNQNKGDLISRQAVLDEIENYSCLDKKDIKTIIKALPSVENKGEIKHGYWVRMSDLPEDKDDRYKCSRCGNVVHHSNGVNLYTFNSWCGRCGSLNNSLLANMRGE